MKYTPSQAQMAVNVFLKAGDTAAAQGVIEQAENNNRPDLYCAIASVQISQHQVDDAVGSYLKALAISPEHKDASKGIACLYAGKAAQCVDNQDFDLFFGQ